MKCYNDVSEDADIAKPRERDRARAGKMRAERMMLRVTNLSLATDCCCSSSCYYDYFG